MQASFKGHMLKRFHFQRNTDVSGVSGTGDVAQGVLFGDGQIAIHWEGPHSSIAIYKSLDDLLFIHGHDGATVIVWDDK
jgi:hypothetical protein